tara:strand:- start:2308 stop:2691 length:384 start_codon:yes stop_codon:yes gene_type:complete
MSTGNLQIVTVAKRLISATTSKGLAMAVKVGRFIKELGLVENPSFTDSPTFTVTKVLSDSANFAGEPVLVPARLLSNSGGFTDTPVFSVGKALADSSGFSDSGVILAQNYAGPDYFGQDFIGTQTTF